MINWDFPLFLGEQTKYGFGWFNVIAEEENKKEIIKKHKWEFKGKTNLETLFTCKDCGTNLREAETYSSVGASLTYYSPILDCTTNVMKKVCE